MRIKFASLPYKTPSVNENRRARAAQRIVRRPDGGHHRSAVPRLARASARLAVSEMVSSRPELREVAQDRGCASTTAARPAPSRCRSPAPTRRCWPRRRATTSAAARRSSTSTWAARRRRSATRRGLGAARDEPLVARILEAVVSAVDVPVTLKIRTGWGREQPQCGARRAHRRARRHAGARDPRPHARLRVRGSAEYDTIAEVKAAVRIPVIANGDIARPRRRGACSTTPAPTA